jgi:type II secretory pathway component PulK
VSHGEWGIVPIISTGDTEVRVRWEDERSKVNINDVNSTREWVDELFSQRGVGTDVVVQVKDLRKEGPLRLLSELHKVMSDEDYNKVARFLIVRSDITININTASEEVLNSILRDPNIVSTILRERKKDKGIESLAAVGLDQQNPSTYIKSILSYLDTKNGALTVHSHATVGGFTKQIESMGTYWSVK